MERLIEQHGFTHKYGRNINSEAIRNNKSTEPFRVILTEQQDQHSHTKNIEHVHQLLGDAVNEIVKKFHSQLYREFRT